MKTGEKMNKGKKQNVERSIDHLVFQLAHSLTQIEFLGKEKKEVELAY